MAFIYNPRNELYPKLDKNLCRASVWGDYRDHQCTRKIAVRREVNGVERGFCRQHDPEAEEARRKARHAKWKAESNERKRRWDREQAIKTALEACKAAIEKIAAGHNDARALAVETLALFPKDET